MTSSDRRQARADLEKLYAEDPSFLDVRDRLRAQG